MNHKKSPWAPIIHRLFRSGAKALCICLLFSSPTLQATELAPSDIVEGFQANLIQVMKEAKNLSVRERFNRLSPSVEEAFHMHMMIQIATGSYWKEATATERKQLVEAFHHMSVTSLATLFDGYSGEVFKLVKESPGPQKTRIVRTKLRKSDKSTIDIAYVMLRFKEGWKIIDVILDSGISELKVRQSEYRMVLKKEGVPGLISLLNNTADELISK